MKQIEKETMVAAILTYPLCQSLQESGLRALTEFVLRSLIGMHIKAKESVERSQTLTKGMSATSSIRRELQSGDNYFLEESEFHSLVSELFHEAAFDQADLYIARVEALEKFRKLNGTPFSQELEAHFAGLLEELWKTLSEEEQEYVEAKHKNDFVKQS